MLAACGQSCIVSYILENSDNCFTAAGLMSRSIICCNTTVSSYRYLLYIVELEVKQSNKLIIRSGFSARILLPSLLSKSILSETIKMYFPQ